MNVPFCIKVTLLQRDMSECQAQAKSPSLSLPLVDSQDKRAQIREILIVRELSTVGAN